MKKEFSIQFFRPPHLPLNEKPVHKIFFSINSSPKKKEREISPTGELRFLNKTAELNDGSTQETKALGTVSPQQGRHRLSSVRQCRRSYQSQTTASRHEAP